MTSRFVLASTLWICLTAFAQSQDIDKLPMITVTGNASVLTSPDEVTLHLSIKKEDKDLQVAKRLNDDSIKQILDLTRRFSVLPQNVQTAQIAVEMKYDPVRDEIPASLPNHESDVRKRIFRGYEVSKMMTIKLTDIARYEDFFSEVLKTGVSEVNGVIFGTSKLRENKDTARDMAMKAAKEKATAMAAAVGQKIGKALKIVEGSLGTVPYGNYQLSANGIQNNVGFDDDNGVFAPGVVKVEAQVTVSFQLD